MSTASDTDQAAITRLRSEVRGAVHRPGDPDYPSPGFNVAVPRTPWAVVDVADAADIAAVVAFAAANAMTVTVFATGHGGTPVDDRSILVRTNALDECVVDPATRTARVGAGVPWQTVIEQAAAHGLAPLCGSAPGVSAVGFLSGGGIGPFVRTFGVSSDRVRSFGVVTGNGEIKHAAPEENPELFWGLRGGKATLGIITDAVIDLLPITEFYGGAVYFDGADAPEVLAAWQRWTTDLPREASTSLALLRLPDMPGVPPVLAGRLTVAVRYASVAAPDSAAQAFAPIRAVAAPILDAVGVMPYAAIGAIHADPVHPAPAYEGGLLLSELPDDAAAALLRNVGPEVMSPLLVVELRLLGGAYADPPAVTSAFCHRDAAINLHAVGILAPPIAAMVPEATARLVADMAPWAAGGRLPNFTAGTDPATIRSCYDDDTAAWLSALAQQYDPAGVLRAGQVMR
ncbi:FAD-binding oxidoreductase [Gordonia sp. NPDC003429]